MANYEYANNPQTTLSGAATAGATAITVASATGFPTKGKFTIIVDSEIMLVTGVSGTTWTVERGAEDTAAAAHNNNAAVTGILTKKSFLDAFHFDVRAYGAKGDGTTDDSAAVQAAIDAAAVAGGTVFFPPGTYLCNTTLTVAAGKKVQIVGAGPQVSVIEKTAANTNSILSVGGTTPGTQGFRIAHLKIEGSGTAGEYGIYLDTLTEGNNIIEDVWVHGSGWGIGLHKTYGFTISHVRLNENASGGLQIIRDGVSGDTNQITIVSPWFKQNFGPGLQIETGTCAVIGGSIEGNQTGAPTTQDNILIRSDAYSCTFTGVYVENAQRNNVRIVGVDDGEAGVPTNIAFLNCYFNNSLNNNALLSIGDAEHVLVENCRFVGNETPISISASANKVTIRGMRNATGVAISNSGGTNVIIEDPGVWLTPMQFLAGEADTGVPANPPTIRSAGDNEYMSHDLPHDASPATTSIVTQFPVPLGWRDALASLKVTVYEMAVSSGAGGNIKLQYTAKPWIPGTDVTSVAYTASSTVTFTRDATKINSHAFSGLIGMSATAEMLRLRIARLSADAADTYVGTDMILGVYVERVQ